MGKISILIASYDEMYNEALAAAFMDINKNISVTAVPFEDIKHGHSKNLENYDAMLMEEMPKGSADLKSRMMFFTDKKAAGDVNYNERVYKYQKAERIFELLYETKIKDCRDTERACCNEYEIDETVRKALSVGVLSLDDSSACCCLGIIMAKALAYSGRKTVYFDFSEFQSDLGQYIKNEGNRSWDDLIYCCVYGINDDILSRPEIYASEDESGFLFFRNSDGRNPYRDMESEEKKKLHKCIREKLRAEINISYIKCDSMFHTFFDAQHYDVLIIVQSGSSRGIREGDELKKMLTGAEGFKGEILDICSGSKWQDIPERDFSVFFSEDTAEFKMDKLVCSGTWKDVLRITGYIDKNV